MVRRNQAPDVTDRLRGYVSRFASAWAVAHQQGNPRAGEWIQLAVAALRAEHPDGPRWVCNGKRGNPNDLSWDVVGYVVDEANGDPRMVECYDVIGMAGTPQASIVWNNITNYDTIGQPGTAVAVIPSPLPQSGGSGTVTPPPPPPPPQTVDLGPVLSALAALDAKVSALAVEVGLAAFEARNAAVRALDIAPLKDAVEALPSVLGEVSQPAGKAPAYRGRVPKAFGGTAEVTLYPVEQD